MPNAAQTPRLPQKRSPTAHEQWKQGLIFAALQRSERFIQSGTCSSAEKGSWQLCLPAAKWHRSKSDGNPHWACRTARDDAGTWV